VALILQGNAMNYRVVINLMGNGKLIVVRMAAIFSLTLLPGCLPSQLSAYRTPADPPTENCAPDDVGRVVDSCGRASHEHATFSALAPSSNDPGYDLLFAEFDDAGWVNRTAADSTPRRVGLQTGGAISPPDDEITRIEDFIQALDPCQPLRIVVFVHGWKHDADTDDDNVKWARMQLKGIAEAEGAKRRVIGIYIGWRGTPIVAPDVIQDLTFWDRKSVAEQVAQGSVNELLAFITTYEHTRNSISSCNLKPNLTSGAGNVPAPIIPGASSSPQVVTVFVGHSFGGLILYEALAPRILDSLVSVQLDMKLDLPGRLRRGVDMIVLINPAIEATRFQPLYRAMKYASQMEHQAPLMVLVTSTADEATGDAFPIARRLWQPATNSDEEREAYRETIGHMQAYITHDLILQANGEPTCRPPNRSGASDALCFADSTLTPRDGPYNTFPVWNISTDKSEIKSHDDISEPQFVRFMVALTQYGMELPVLSSLPPTGNSTASTYSRSAP
jgi:hypothetical protein